MGKNNITMKKRKEEKNFNNKGNIKRKKGAVFGGCLDIVFVTNALLLVFTRLVTTAMVLVLLELGDNWRKDRDCLDLVWPVIIAIYLYQIFYIHNICTYTMLFFFIILLFNYNGTYSVFI